MPKANNNTPESLRPYIFHGIELAWKDGDEEAIGNCPWCGREKFSVNIPTAQWRCLVCNEGTEKEKTIKGGNVLVFLRMLWERSYTATPGGEYLKLATERKLLNADTLAQWGLAKSSITDEWLLPGYSSDSKQTGLYKYVFSGGRKLWMPTPTLGHHLLGMNLFVRDDDHELIYVAEGLWDSVAWWETLGLAREEGGAYKSTSNRDASLLASENVVGIASNLAFNEAWISLFTGKVVCLLCQNDHEKRMCRACRKSYSKHQCKECPNCGATEVTDLVIPPASYVGMERIAKQIGPVAESVHYLYWGENGYDGSLPSGYDVRDLLTR